MRHYLTVAFVICALMPVAAAGQETGTTTQSGSIDLGVRGSNLTGDAARYERYRDMGDGLFLETFRW